MSRKKIITSLGVASVLITLSLSFISSQVSASLISKSSSLMTIKPRQTSSESRITNKISQYFISNKLITDSFYDQIIEPGFPIQTYRTSGSYMGGQGIHTLVADITGDVRPEIIFQSLDYQYLTYVYDSEGNLLWTKVQPHGGVSVAAVSDRKVVLGGDNYDLGVYDGEGNQLWTNYSYTDDVIYPPSVAKLNSLMNGNGIFTERGNWRYNGFYLDQFLNLPGWPTDMMDGSYHSHTPAIADIDNDGEIEIVTATDTINNTTYIYAFNEDSSTLWEKSYSGFAHTIPVIGDVDGDNELEVVVIPNKGSDPWNAVLKILDSQGQEEVSVQLPNRVGWGTAPALADINKDMIPEIIISLDNYLVVKDGQGNDLPGFPINFGDPNYEDVGNSSPVVGDVDNDGFQEIVLSTYDINTYKGTMRVINHDGTYVSGFPFELPYLSMGSVPAVVDIDLDQHLEIVITGDYWDGQSKMMNRVWAFDLVKAQPSSQYIDSGDNGINTYYNRVEWGQFAEGPAHNNAYIENRPDDEGIYVN